MDPAAFSRWLVLNGSSPTPISNKQYRWHAKDIRTDAIMPLEATMQLCPVVRLKGFVGARDPKDNRPGISTLA